MKQQMMGLGRKFTCFYLLLLLLLFQLESSSTSNHDHGSARHGSFKQPVSAFSDQQFMPVQSHGHGFEAGNHDHKVKDGDDDDDDEDFGDEKRKVHTGPNPLHNR